MDDQRPLNWIRLLHSNLIRLPWEQADGSSCKKSFSFN